MARAHFVFVLVSLVVLFGVYAAVAAEAPVQEKNDAATDKKITVEDSVPFELAYGQSEAPVTVVEYASLSCSHCGAFYKTVFSALKEKYIDTGKVHFIYRHFPLNLSALKAAMLVSCAPEEKKRNFLNVLFKTQDDWAFEREFEQKLKTIATLGGMNEEAFTTCMTNQSLEDSIVTSRLLTARQLGVSSTPTFFINGKKYDGERTLAGFAQEIDPLLPAAEKVVSQAPAEATPTSETKADEITTPEPKLEAPASESEPKTPKPAEIPAE